MQYFSQKLFQFPLTTCKIGSTINIDEQMFGTRNGGSGTVCGGSVDGVFVVEWVRISDGYGAVVVATEETSHSKVGRPTESDLALQHNEVNIFGAWRLAALGSGVTSGNTGYLSVRWQNAHGDRGVLRRVAGVSLTYVGWVQRLAALHTGGAGGVLLRQGLFLLLFFRG